MSRKDRTMNKIEQLASELHDIYQKEAKRQGDHRHFDKYEDLAESVKEYDRVLARHILEREKQQAEQIRQLEDKLMFRIEDISRLEAQNKLLKELVYRMGIIHPDGYPKPMEKMIADIYNEKQQRVDDEHAENEDY